MGRAELRSEYCNWKIMVSLRLTKTYAQIPGALYVKGNALISPEQQEIFSSHCIHFFCVIPGKGLLF